MQFQCPYCQSILSSDAVSTGAKVQCPECGNGFTCQPYDKKPVLKAIQTGTTVPAAGEIPEVLHTKLASAIGIEKLKGFKLSDLFSEVFSRHSREEVEESFTVGTPSSTPDILAVDTSWPRPWLFTRMLIASLVLYVLFWIGWRQFENPKLIPGWIILGSFAVPISTLVLFLEINVRRNVSLYMVARLTFLGGILSLLMALVLFQWFDDGTWGASIAGPIEETGKVLAMLAVARAAQYRYKLNGLLVGAAVGVGFAAFESAGYALEIMIDSTVDATFYAASQNARFNWLSFGISHGASSMENNLIVRGLLSPFGHIVWSAIAGCGLWRVIRGRPFRWSMIVDVEFIRLFLVPVVLHMIWNAPFELPFFGKYILVGLVGWFVCISLVQEGLREIAEEQTAAKDNAKSNSASVGTENTEGSSK